ncbi:MAG: metallophosphoesterase family protein [Crocinitomicaceae bacterium]
MKLFRYTFYLLLTAAFFYGCAGSEGEVEMIDEPVVHSFVVAGHAYGNPDTYTSSIYPPLLVELDSLIENVGIHQLILTGDVVAHPTPENWETVRGEIEERKIDEWYIAPGNHDISPYMDMVIQSQKYMAHIRENNLFLILNTSHPGWTLDSTQCKFVESTLKEQANAVDNIFVFSHQLWWLNQPPNSFELDSLRPNSFALLDSGTTFWQDAFPYFRELDNEVYFFAGDMGCHFSLPGHYEDHHKNFHFFGSGMGGAVEDNLLHGKIYQDGRVEIVRIDF